MSETAEITETPENSRVGQLSGYPSIDKPWLKYYREDAINAPLPKMTMYEYVREQNKDNLKGTAFQYFGRKITYAEFFKNVKEVARALTAYGVKAGDIVTIMSMHTPETAYAIYGLNYIGAAANLVYVTLTEEEILRTVHNTESKLLLVLDPFAETIAKIREKLNIPVIILSVADSMPNMIGTLYRLKKDKSRTFVKNGSMLDYRSFLAKGKEIGDRDIQKAGKPEDTAVIVYTSGTTAEPKGVCLSNDAMNAVAFQDIEGLVDFSVGKTCLFILPPFIGFGATQLHVLLCGRVNIILLIEREPEAITKNFFKYKPYCFLTGPATLKAITEHKQDHLEGVSYVMGGGGAIPHKLEEDVNAFLHSCHSKARYSNGYGMTEAGSLLTVNVNEVNKKDSIGIPIFKTNVKAIDVDSNEECSYGVVGELYFKTPNLMNGYFKNSEADREVIAEIDGERWIKTGDLGYIDEDGFVFLTGRIKRIFATKGPDNNPYKIFPLRIEDFISSLEAVELCGVIAREDPVRVNIPIAYAQLKPGYDSSALPHIIDEVNAGLPEHLRPEEIFLIDKMPITPSGKIDYRELEKTAGIK